MTSESRPAEANGDSASPASLVPASGRFPFPSFILLRKFRDQSSQGQGLLAEEELEPACRCWLACALHFSCCIFVVSAAGARAL